MNTKSSFPREFRIPASQDHVRSIKDPHTPDISVIHALVKVCDLPNGKIPDRINPRCHEKLKMSRRIPAAIEESIRERPELFHLLNRGCLILAQRAWYDNKTKILHFVIENDDDFGMVDGATTDRVLAELKRQLSDAEFDDLAEDEIPKYFKDAYIHIEIVTGEIEQDLRIKLADARNTSEQVKEFSLQDLGGYYDWLKEIIENSEFKGKVRYKENDPKPFDIRVVLALLTLFHPRWIESNKDPIIAYTGKGTVLDIYKGPEAHRGYIRLKPVVIDILRLYEFVHIESQQAYKEAYGGNGGRAQLGKRKGVKYIDKPKKAKILPLTGKKTQYVLPDGWLYPMIGSLRMLLDWPSNPKEPVRWIVDPFDFFRQHGSDLIFLLIEKHEELGRNPNATGKSKGAWGGLRDRVENLILREKNLVLRKQLQKLEEDKSK